MEQNEILQTLQIQKNFCLKNDTERNTGQLASKREV